MDSVSLFSLMPVLVVPIILLNVTWYVAVLVLLVRIWQRVRHLPVA